MKLFIVACLLLIATFCYAGDVQLGWDSNTEPEVIGYNLYFKNHINETYRLMSEIREQDLDNPLMPEIKLWNLTDNLTYYFVLTAFSSTDESGHSNEVPWINTPKPAPEPTPGNGGGCFINSLR